MCRARIFSSCLFPSLKIWKEGRSCDCCVIIKCLSFSFVAVEDKRDVIHCAVHEINDETVTSSAVEQIVTEMENKQTTKQANDAVLLLTPLSGFYNLHGLA